MNKIKQTDDGFFEWIDCGHGSGFWAKIRDPEMLEYRMPTECPACNSWLYNWDAQYWNRNGVCCDCSVSWLEERPNLPAFKTNKERAEYVKQKIAEKTKKE